MSRPFNCFYVATASRPCTKCSRNLDRWRGLAAAAFVVLSGCSGGGGADDPGLTTIVSHPTDQVVQVGQQATFTVVTTGAETSYQWYRGSQAIPGAKGSVYTTPPVVQSDDGYRFWAHVYVVAGHRAVPVPTNVATLTVLPGFVPVPGTFTEVGRLLTERDRHTATLLQDGRVLLTGGYNNGFLASAELFDPATGTFSATGSMTSRRASHSATLLESGKVLVAGGYLPNSGEATNSAELYDPATGLFSAVASMANARAAHSATLLADGQVLIAGGVSGPFDVTAAELFDPSRDAFVPTGTLPGGRVSHKAFRRPDGRVMLAAGDRVSPLTVDLYDPVSGTFTRSPSLTTVAVIQHTATDMPDGTLLILGGRNGTEDLRENALHFDPAIGTATTKGRFVFGRVQSTVTRLPSGQLLIVGGQGDGRVIERAELYDPVADVFAVTGPLLAGRTGHSATLLSDGRVLIAGGGDPRSPPPALIFSP